MAPPFTLTLDASHPRPLLTAQACAANASFDSMRSRSATLQPAFFNAIWDAGIGPVPISLGSTPALAHDTMRPSGVIPRASASLADISTKAAAPSFRPDALPAVTEPSLAKAG